MRVRLVVVVPIQPTELVPLTVYTVETVGETIICELVKAPGFQVKVLAPDAESVALAPEQNVPVLLTLTVGLGLTFNCKVLVPRHVPDCEDNVYTVVTVGFTTIEVVLDPDGFQV
jgi:hypothetical protein